MPKRVPDGPRGPREEPIRAQDGAPLYTFSYKIRALHTQITVLPDCVSAMSKNHVFLLLRACFRCAETSLGNTVKTSVKSMDPCCFRPNAVAFPLQMTVFPERPWTHPETAVFPLGNMHSAISQSPLQNTAETCAKCTPELYFCRKGTRLARK